MFATWNCFLPALFKSNTDLLYFLFFSTLHSSPSDIQTTALKWELKALIDASLWKHLKLQTYTVFFQKQAFGFLHHTVQLLTRAVSDSCTRLHCLYYKSALISAKNTGNLHLQWLHRLFLWLTVNLPSRVKDDIIGCFYFPFLYLHRRQLGNDYIKQSVLNQ